MCFVHPTDTNVCIKVMRPDRDLAARRARKGIKGRFKPASAFDENAEEAATLSALHDSVGPALAAHVPRFLGWIESDLGRGAMTDLIRDTDGRISITLKQHLWEHGDDPAIRDAVAEFADFWIEHRVPSRDLLLHNIVLRTDTDGSFRLVVIDGLGNSDWLPLSRWSKSLARRKSARKVANLRQRMQALMAIRVRQGDPGVHGFLPESARNL